MLIVWIVTGLAIAVAVWLGFWMLVTFLVGQSERQKQFIAAQIVCQSWNLLTKASRTHVTLTLSYMIVMKMKY